MKLPFIRRTRHEAALAHEKARRKKADEAARKAMDRAESKLRSVEEQFRAAQEHVEKRLTAGEYVPFAWSPPGAHLQIEETWSNDSSFGMRGFVLVETGAPQDVQIKCDGLPPDFMEWMDRPDVSAHATFARFPQQVECGFYAVFARRAAQRLTVTLPSAPGCEPASVTVPATGFSPREDTVPKGLLLEAFAERVNRECRSVLEIGSRIVSPGSKSRRTLFAPHVTYTGFDYYADDNTDVVGDAHQLSKCFPLGAKFDAVFSTAVLEHVAMPWKVAMEINRVLPIGGLSFHWTPFAWPLHETPWDFWRYSHEGLRMLFSPALGFEVLDMGLSHHCRIHFEFESRVINPFSPMHPAYGESNILVRKVAELDEERFRWSTSMDEVLPPDSAYPKPGGGAT